MGKNTAIGWCDDTVNGEAGCDGCELARPDMEPDEVTCYAKHLVDRYAGLKGWPDTFFEPKLFPGRIAAACRWKDLTGTRREHKPWLDAMPRLIFLNDLGDTFSESLPVDWLLDDVPAMEASPHIWLILTKRPARMRRFFELLGRVPANFWPGVSVTRSENRGRLAELFKIRGASVSWCSYEPALGPVDFGPYLSRPAPEAYRVLSRHYGPDGFDETGSQPAGERFTGRNWLIIGAESGPNARPMSNGWARAAKDACVAAGVPVFFKQAATETGRKILEPALDGRQWTEMPIPAPRSEAVRA